MADFAFDCGHRKRRKLQWNLLQRILSYSNSKFLSLTLFSSFIFSFVVLRCKLIMLMMVWNWNRYAFLGIFDVKFFTKILSSSMNIEKIWTVVCLYCSEVLKGFSFFRIHKNLMQSKRMMWQEQMEKLQARTTYVLLV